MSSELALVADVGGTNIRIALATAEGLQATQSWLCAEFDTIEAALRRYLELSDLEAAPRIAAIAVAGPVDSDWIDLTNQDWSFSVDELRRSLGLDKLRLINDFTALAASIPRLAPEDVRLLKEGLALEGAAIAVLGPGTGLGVSGLIPSQGGWIPLSAEGGHCDLAATSEEEWAVVEILRQKFGRVSNERILSGPGLVNLYQALCTLTGDQPRNLTPADIVVGANSRAEGVEATAVRMFSGWLGSVAGDLVLSLGAKGGVYVGGGVVPKMLEVIDRAYFIDRFLDKGRMANYVRDVPVHIVLNTRIALVGLVEIIRNA